MIIKIIEEIKRKEILTNRVFEEKKLIAQEIKEENEEKMKEANFNREQKEKEKENKRNKLKDEWNDKRKRVDEFLREKEQIAKEIKYISDQATLRRQIYCEQFDNIISKKGLDKKAYLKFKGMIDDEDPQFKQLCKYYEDKKEIIYK